MKENFADSVPGFEVELGFQLGLVLVVTASNNYITFKFHMNLD